jgi:hypothetical protein
MADTTVTISGVNGNGRKRLADRTAGSGFFNEEEGGAATSRLDLGFGVAGAGSGTIFCKRITRRHGQGDTDHKHRKKPDRYGKTFRCLHQLSSRWFRGHDALPAKKILNSFRTRFGRTLVRCRKARVLRSEDAGRESNMAVFLGLRDIRIKPPAASKNRRPV